jgi:hypothetical protein
MALSDPADSTCLPQSPYACADTMPLANTDSTTDSGESFISQVPRNFSPSSYSPTAQLPHQAAAQVLPMIDHNFPAGAQGMSLHPVIIFQN